jgi:hypothetical protein
LRCADLLVIEDEQYKTLLCDYLHRFIIYPSVLRVAERSLEGFDMPKLQIAPSATSKIAQTAYKQFIVSIAKLTVIKECGAGHGQEVCSNTKVSLLCCVSFVKHHIPSHRGSLVP